jgi:hypothetical protein
MRTRQCARHRHRFDPASIIHQYREEYGALTDRLDQKVKSIEAMPIYQAIMGLQPPDSYLPDPGHLQSNAVQDVSSKFDNHRMTTVESANDFQVIESHW